MSKKMKGSALGGDCGADCIGRMLLIPTADFSAGTLRSSGPRRTATRLWWSSSSPRARDSMSKTITGRALVATASAARYSTRQRTSLGRFTALIGAAMKGHTLVVEQLIAAGARLDVQDSDG